MGTTVLHTQQETEEIASPVADDNQLQPDGTENAQSISPFLPGTQIQFAWDSTSLELYKRCPRLYYYTMIEGWSTKGEGIHLRFGIEYHQALHDYELCKADGLDHEESLHHTVRALLERTHDWKPEPRTNSEKVKTQENLLRTVVWYLDTHRNDPAKTIIFANGKPAIEVSFRFELDWGPAYEEGRDNPQPYVLCGHLDRLVNYLDDTYFMDRKTASSTPGPYYFNQYQPHNQMSLYTLASQVVYKTPIKGGIIDAAYIAVNFSAFVRGMTFRTPDQLDEWTGDLAYYLGDAEESALEGHWRMNDTACDKYGGCRFRDVCNKSPKVREKFLQANFVKGEPWNPLKPR